MKKEPRFIRSVALGLLLVSQLMPTALLAQETISPSTTVTTSDSLVESSTLPLESEAITSETSATVVSSSETNPIDDTIVSSSETDTGVDSDSDESTQPLLEQSSQSETLDSSTETLPSSDENGDASSGLTNPKKDKVVSEKASVNPIHIRIDAAPHTKRSARINATIDWQPRSFNGTVEVVDNKGRLMFRSDYFYFTKMKGTKRILGEHFPNGVYTVIVRGETDYRDGNQKFIGRAAFKMENYLFAGQTVVPPSLSGITTAKNYVNVGVNPIHLDLSKYYSSVRVTGHIEWNPYAYSGDLKILDIKGRLMDSSESFRFSDLDVNQRFSVANYPDGIYIVVTTGKTDERNGNQTFYGHAAFEVRGGKFLQTVKVPKAFLDARNLKAVHRMYHSGLKVHLYTTDENERNVLMDRNWKYEGVSWKTETTKGTPVYRLYHQGLRYHFYTKDENEYNTLGKRGWKQEGVAYRNHGSIPIYRMYHRGLRKHLYTRDANEYKVLASRGWKQEGIAWYSQP